MTTKLSKKRLIELDKNIMKSMGWKSGATEVERKIINKRWDKMAGHTSFHDAIRKMIKEQTKRK